MRTQRAAPLHHEHPAFVSRYRTLLPLLGRANHNSALLPATFVISLMDFAAEGVGMRFVGLSLALTATFGLVGCSDDAVPRSPIGPNLVPNLVRESSTIPVVPDPPIVSGPVRFALQVSEFKVHLFRPDSFSRFQYGPTVLRLRETSGKSSATLKSIHVDALNAERGRDCGQDDTVRGETIAAGDTRDFEATLGYCMPYAVTGSEVSEVTFTARFEDEGGNVAEVRGSTSVAGCALSGKPGLVPCE